MNRKRSRTNEKANCSHGNWLSTFIDDRLLGNEGNSSSNIWIRSRIDYKEGEFILYFQALNFADIAKQEGATALQEKTGVVIGKGKGESIEEAFTELEQNAALPLYIGHVNSFILSEDVINKKMKDFIEYVGKEPLLRYNSWLFVTNEDIKKVFNGDSFFNLPNLFTIIQRPETVINENYFISPLKFSELVSKFYQPVGSILIPSMVINEHHYTDRGKEKRYQR